MCPAYNRNTVKRRERQITGVIQEGECLVDRKRGDAVCLFDGRIEKRDFEDETVF